MPLLSRAISVLPAFSLLIACGSSDSSHGHGDAGSGGAATSASGGSMSVSGGVPNGGSAASGASSNAGNGGKGTTGGGSSAGGNGNSGGKGAGGSSGSLGTGGSNEPDAGPIVAPEPLSANIVVDQFGYRTTAEKVAVIRSPQRGYDAGKAFTPGATYALVDSHTGAKKKEGAPAAWNGGATDSSSGDKAWWFDFSSVTTPGDYYVLDESGQARSDVIRIADDVYRDVLV